MRHYQDDVQDSAGNILGSATVTVYYPGTTTLAPIYSDNNGTTKTNPFLADAVGRFSFYVPPGRYDIKATSVSGDSYTQSGVDITGPTVQLSDYIRGDANHLDTASMTNGSAVLTCTGGSFSANDVGKVIEVKGAGSAGLTLRTTISSVTSANNITLAAAASSTVSNVRAIYGTDDTSAWASALTAASGKTLSVGDCKTLITASTSNITVPSNTTILGSGENSVVYFTGVGTSVLPTNTATGYIGLYIQDSSSNIRIEGLRFVGLNSPFTYYAQDQSSVIAAHGTSGSSIVPTDIVVNKCSFNQLFGFSVHNAGLGLRFDVTNCHLYENSNGINVNSDHSQQTGNHLFNTESIECSGNYALIADNDFYSTFTGATGTWNSVSIGGNTSPGQLTVGTVVKGNRFTGRGCAGAFTITVNDSCTNCQVTDNTLYKTESGGIQVQSGGFNAVKGTLLANNTFLNCGRSTDPNPHGIYVAGGGSGVSDTVIRNNVFMDTAEASYSLKFGVVNSATNTVIRGNKISVTLDALLNTGGSAIFGDNDVQAGAISVTGGSLNASVEYGGTTWKDATGTTKASMTNAGALTVTSEVFSGSSSGSTTVQASATASGTLTLPAATDTLVGKATTDTLTNKTIDTAGSNTIKVNGNSLSATAGTATITIPNSTETLVGRATTDTLTNKTIDTAGPNTLKVNGNTLSATAGSATVTIPNSTDTLVGKATTDTLTNKTLNSSTNAITLVGSGYANSATLLNWQKGAAALTGNSTDQTLYTYTIPANTIAAGKGFRVRFNAQHTTGTGAVTYKWTVGATTVSTITDSTAIANQYVTINTILMNEPGVQNSQTASHESINIQNTFVTPPGTSGHVSAENFANAVTVKVTFNAANTEQVTPLFFMLEAIQ